MEAVVKSKYSLEMGKSTEEELKVKLVMSPTGLQIYPREWTKPRRTLSGLEGIVLVEDNVKHHNFTLCWQRLNLTIA